MTQLRAYAIDMWLKTLNPNAVVMIDDGELVGYDANGVHTLTLGTVDDHNDPLPLTDPGITWEQIQNERDEVALAASFGLSLSPIEVFVTLPKGLD